MINAKQSFALSMAFRIFMLVMLSGCVEPINTPIAGTDIPSDAMDLYVPTNYSDKYVLLFLVGAVLGYWVWNWYKKKYMLDSHLLPPKVYLLLEEIEVVYPGALSIIEKHNPNYTICPVCRADDFTHVEGCKLKEEKNIYSSK